MRMSNEGPNKVRGWVGNVPDIDDVPNTTSQRFAIWGELAAVTALTKILEFSNHNPRARVPDCNN